MDNGMLRNLAVLVSFIQLSTAALLMMLTSGAALAQQPTPLFPAPAQPPQTVQPGEVLPPLETPQPPATTASPPPATEPQPPAAASPPPEPEPQPPAAAAAPPSEAAPSRVFCGQTVSYQLADPASVPAPYRQFIGLWSDAAWTPELCAALIVENVTQDGTATITYAFGPIGSGNEKPGGILHGTGVIQDDELRFQNNDGSQFGFKTFYADLVGHLTTPKGDTYEAIFKKAF